MASPFASPVQTWLATSVIDPSGRCQAYLPYGQEGVLVEEIDPARASGTLAMRFAPERYAEQDAD